MMDVRGEWLALAGCLAEWGRPVVIVDLETTGGNLYEDRVTEVALLRFEQGRVSHFESLVNPNMPIPPFITRLTGIDDEMVADSPSFAEIAGRLRPLLQGSVVVAHNSKFDYTFLRHEFRRAGMDFAAPALCTVQLSRKLYPQFHKHNLDSIIERCGIQTQERHRAMADVAALADFLAVALCEQSWETVSKQGLHLMNPKMMPPHLSERLSADLYALPDTAGVLSWWDGRGNLLYLDRVEKAFSEVAARLNTRMPAYAQEADSVRFAPACGPLHSLYLKAQLADEYGWREQEKSSPYLTVQFRMNEQGSLQAKLVPLAPGRHVSRPFGLFLHKKAARRALNEWRVRHRLCPAVLDILPEGYVRGSDCPVRQVGDCDGHCLDEAGRGVQNETVLRHAADLPVTDWGLATAIEVIERDTVSGQSVTLRCAGGALLLPDGSWYFDTALPAVLKAKFKAGQPEVIAAML